MGSIQHHSAALVNAATVADGAPIASDASLVKRSIADDGLRRKVGEGAYTSAQAYRENDRLREWADTLIGDN